ncbi:MAG: nitrogen fixation protein NifM [Pseudomonadota bacterium]
MNPAYLVLKAAHNLFGKSPVALVEAEMAQAQRMAQRQSELEELVLATAEARDVVVPAATLKDALAAIRGRYEDEETFRDDLARNGLSPEDFADALEQELKVEAILERVGQRAAAVSEIDVELYYHYHPDQFRRIETRIARHILITVNEAFAENRREDAYARIEAIAQRLTKEPKRFEEQAMKHSECPTALQGGLLGEVHPGKLFPELEQVLFGLHAGELSGIVESSLGFHLLRCDAVSPASTLSLKDARGHIRRLLEARRKRVCQQAWLKALRQAPVAA